MKPSAPYYGAKRLIDERKKISVPPDMETIMVNNIPAFVSPLGDDINTSVRTRGSKTTGDLTDNTAHIEDLSRRLKPNKQQPQLKVIRHPESRRCGPAGVAGTPRLGRPCQPVWSNPPVLSRSSLQGPIRRYAG